MPDGTEAEARAILQDAPDEWGDNSFWDLLHERHRRLLVARIATALRARTAERDAAREQLQVSREISGTFWEALKPLNLTAINVANPGRHVTDLLQERDRLAERVREWESAAQDVIDNSAGLANFKTILAVERRAIERLAAALQAGARGERP